MTSFLIVLLILSGSLLIHLIALFIVNGDIEQLLWLPSEIYYHSNLNWLAVILLYILYWVILPFFAFEPVLKLIFTRR